MREARVADHGGEGFLLGEATDAFDEILIGRAVAGRQFAEARDDLERMEIIDAVENRDLNFGKFKAHEAAAGAEHAVGFCERAVDMGDVADAEGDRVGVEALVGERQGLGVANRQRDPI